MLAVNNQAEYNFVHFGFLGYFFGGGGGQFNLFRTNNKYVFLLFIYLRHMINSLNVVLYLSDLDICG